MSVGSNAWGPLTARASGWAHVTWRRASLGSAVIPLGADHRPPAWNGREAMAEKDL